MNRVCTQVCTSWPHEWDGRPIRARAGRQHPYRPECQDRHYPGVCSGRVGGQDASIALDQQCETPASGDLTTPP